MAGMSWENGGSLHCDFLIHMDSDFPLFEALPLLRDQARFFDVIYQHSWTVEVYQFLRFVIEQQTSS